MRSAILGTVLTVAAGLAATAAPRAEATAAAPLRAFPAASPVLVASCTATLTGSWTTPLDPGATNAPQAETLHQSGTLTCVDPGGATLFTGTLTRTTVLPAAQCTTIIYNDPSTTTITWTDGTTSKLTLTQAAVVTVLGAAATNGAGAMSADSAKFPGDSIDGAIMTTGPGCGPRRAKPRSPQQWSSRSRTDHSGTNRRTRRPAYTRATTRGWAASVWRRTPPTPIAPACRARICMSPATALPSPAASRLGSPRPLDQRPLRRSARIRVSVATALAHSAGSLPGSPRPHGRCPSHLPAALASAYLWPLL